MLLRAYVPTLTSDALALVHTTAHTEEAQANAEAIQAEVMSDWKTMEITIPAADDLGFLVSSSAKPYQGPEHGMNAVMIGGYRVNAVGALAAKHGLRTGMIILYANGARCTPKQLRADSDALQRSAQLTSDAVGYNDELLSAARQGDLALLVVQRYVLTHG